MAVSFDGARLGRLEDTAAVVGAGETDYAKDYRAPGGQAVGTGQGRYDSYTLASRALKRALDDAGLRKDDIDGLCVSAGLSGERASELWGLNPRWSGGDAAQCIIEAAHRRGALHDRRPGLRQRAALDGQGETSRPAGNAALADATTARPSGTRTRKTKRRRRSRAAEGSVRGR